ncbi:MAG: AMP-binding protein [Acidimicrobiaceae bacterium]|nr:AMP-binding protein [Acidimicrobiaceae bacterium]MXZ97930.1 AMP-binding protein [Acidimicrobiaceae bacterium]MYE95835.1 AMP-binding protein [Acidimicrobiaceae bacterium]MYH42509.1 AMP-binding protein [Acidimicrobiaceae bacterium]MYI52636.1 AMP-binding protein [Acidimicrobiaceae bacterium]
MTSPFVPVPLTPVSFLDRARLVHGDRPAVMDGPLRRSYEEFACRCERLAGATLDLGLQPGDAVSVLAPNVSMALEAAFGFPMAGVVFNALNSRLSASELAWIVGHAESKVLLADHGLADVARSIQQQVPGLRLVLSHDAGVSGDSDCEYEALLAAAQPHRAEITDEHSVLSLNYTSGTTGHPKGVMYSHRGANLNALAMAAQCGLDSDAVFLWTLPMFHCNGWCFPWAVTAVGGAHLMLRTLDPDTVWRHVRDDGVTHFNAAPTVLIGLVNHPDAAPAPRTVKVCTGGAPPSPTLLAQMTELNVDVTHLYGLTETYGPSLICDWRSEWDSLPASEQARIKARQGVGTLVTSSVRVIDAGGADVPADGTTQGEIAIRGNNVMLGYYKDPEATAAASADGPGGTWFRTGDMAVMHDHGYVEVRDRAKDVIISGGENIASIEVEQALASHPDVVECAVVAAPDDTWGEVPAAFVVLRAGAAVTEADLVGHVKSRIARFKAPKSVTFGELPKTATGKIQKFALRDQLWAGRDRRVN